MSKQSPEGRAREDISKTLKSVGWTYLGEYETEASVGVDATGYIEEYQTDSGPVDYGLIIQGELYSVIEAKKKSANVTGQFQQLHRYVKNVETQYAAEDAGVPVGFVGNGEEFCRYDFRDHGLNPTTFTSFYTPDELQTLVEKDYSSAINYLDKTPASELDPDLWDHQRDAVDGVKQSLKEGNPYSLIHITTGAGKTRSAMALSYQLLRSGFADSILYIPDSRDIASDVEAKFTEYDPPGSNNSFADDYIIQNLAEDTLHRIENANIVITTLQMMYEIARDNPSDLSAGKFDVIITDECHRSIYNSDGYGQVLRQIDAVEVGLTATPTERTIQRYNGNKAVEYTYKEALKDNNVVPYEAIEVRTQITMRGVEKDGEHYPARHIGRKFSVPDTHRKAAKTIYDEINEKDELTLIFAASDAHATAIVHDLRQAGPFSDEPPEFIQKITYNADNPSNTLNNFKDPYSPPYIAVTVQKIEAGVDIRPLMNVVLLRPVKSPVLLNQMIGRGTRVYDDKEKFRIFDFVGVLDWHDGLPPFATDRHTQTSDSEGQSESSDKSECSDEFEIIDKPDEVILNEKYFRLEGKEGKLTGEEYKALFRLDVQKRADEIDDALRSSDSVTDAKERILDILSGESGYYVPSHIVQVFSNEYQHDFLSDIPSAIQFLNIINDILYGYLPKFDDRIAYARRQLKEKYQLSGIEQEYLSALTNEASPPDGVDFAELRRPPLAPEYSIERAEENFSSTDIRTFVNKFRSLLSDPIDNELHSSQDHHYDIAQEFDLSEKELEILFDALSELKRDKPNDHVQYQPELLYCKIPNTGRVKGSSPSDTHKEEATLDLESILSAVATGIAEPTLGMIYGTISLTIANVHNKEPLSRREAFAYSVLWILDDNQTGQRVEYKTATEAISQAGHHIDDSYLTEISAPDEVISTLDKKGLISEVEEKHGVELKLNYEFNVDWELDKYLSDELPPDLFNA